MYILHEGIRNRMNRSNALLQSSINSKLPFVKKNVCLQIGGCFSLAFALFQASAVFWPPELVAYFGGPARLQIEHPVYFISLCLMIGIIAAVWGLYALSGAGKFRRLPFLRTIIGFVTAVYIFRGLRVIPDYLFISQHPEQHLTRLLIFSLLALCIGFIHLIGFIKLFQRGRSER